MNTQEFSSTPPQFERESIYRPDAGFFTGGKTVFNDEVEGILNRSEAVAREILDYAPKGQERRGDYSCGGARVVHHHCDYWWGPWFYPTHHTTIINAVPESASKRDRDDRVLLGLVFGAIGLGTAYFLGKDWGLSSEAADEQYRNTLDQARFSEFKEAGYNHPHANTVRKIQATEQRIFENIKKEADSGVRLKTSLLAASALGLTGAVIGGTAGWALIPAAIAGSALTSAGLLFRMGDNSAANRNKREAEQMLADVERLKDLRNGQQLRIK